MFPRTVRILARAGKKADRLTKKFDALIFPAVSAYLLAYSLSASPVGAMTYWQSFAGPALRHAVEYPQKISGVSQRGYARDICEH